MPTEKKTADLDGYKADLGLNEKVMVAIVKASELYKKDADAIFKHFGLTFSQYNVLRALNNSRDGRNTVTNTSKIMLTSSPNMTGIAKRLEKAGLIIRRHDPSDERVTVLEITAKGKKVLTDIRSAHDKNILTYVGKFSEKEKKRLLEDLKQVFNKGPRQ